MIVCSIEKSKPAFILKVSYNLTFSSFAWTTLVTGKDWELYGRSSNMLVALKSPLLECAVTSVSIITRHSQICVNKKIIHGSTRFMTHTPCQEAHNFFFVLGAWKPFEAPTRKFEKASKG